MISVIVYGRNDSYGYNLHKRAALSLNSIGEVLSGPQDEIVFVDYNTPNDFPTFPEAIQDTLTSKVRQVLRILRVRPHQHDRFKSASRLVALEPIARNVALRRTSEDSRWVLSTNTDIILSPVIKPSLTDVVRDLDDGLYHLPRFEIPESLWESLDRLQPREVIAKVTRWGRTLHLNEVVVAGDVVGFDAPGDFQLMLRRDAFELGGFHEGMLLGWHVDSNLAKRFSHKYPILKNLRSELLAYHCDHTRQVTAAHRPDRIENDLGDFFERVESHLLPSQEGKWGLADDFVEEIRLSTSDTYAILLESAIGSELPQPSTVAYREESYDQISYDPRHVLPFLVDVLSSYPLDVRVGWFGCQRRMLELFCLFRESLGARQAVRVAEGLDHLGRALPEGAAFCSRDDIAERADVLIFDFGMPIDLDGTLVTDPVGSLARLATDLRCMARFERLATDLGRGSRRFITINAIHNRYESLVRDNIGTSVSPLATRLRQGYVIPARKGARQILSQMHIGGAGARDAGVVSNIPGVPGYIIYGGSVALDPASYRLALSLKASQWSACRIEVRRDEEIVACCLLTERDLGLEEASISFSWSPSASEFWQDPLWDFRVWCDGSQAIELAGLAIETIGSPEADAAIDILPLLQAGSAGVLGYDRATGAAWIEAVEGHGGGLAYGPFCHVQRGRKLVRVALQTNDALVDTAGPVGRLLLRCGDVADLEVPCTSEHLQQGECVVAFDVPSPAPLELQVWTTGTVAFRLTAVTIETDPEASSTYPEPTAVGAHAAQTSDMNDVAPLGTEPAEMLPTGSLLSRSVVGAAGLRVGDIVVGVPGQSGCVVAAGPFALNESAYRVKLLFWASSLSKGELRLEADIGGTLAADRALTEEEMVAGQASLELADPLDRAYGQGAEPVIVRVHQDGGCHVSLLSLTVESS